MESLVTKFVIIAIALTAALAAAIAAWTVRRRRRALAPDQRPKLVIPAASETAAAITRFRRAVLHSDLADYLRS